LHYSKRTRLGIAFLGYWLIVFAVLTFFARGDDFCERPGAPNTNLLAAKLALFLALFDSACCITVAQALRMAVPKMQGFWLGPVLTTLAVGTSLAYLPFWIYEGYGRFRFEQTWADVSCFFTEGYGIGFLIVIPPVLALATFVKAALLRRID